MLGSYSNADIHLFRLFWRFRNALNPAPGECPSLGAHYNRMMARPAVKRIIEVEAAIGYELPAQDRRPLVPLAERRGTNQRRAMYQATQPVLSLADECERQHD